MESTSRFKRLQNQAKDFFEEKNLDQFDERPPSRCQRLAHFWLLVGRSFVRNRCPVRAAALAYTTLLALVPLLAIGISVTTSLLKTQGGEKQVQEMTEKLVASLV